MKNTEGRAPTASSHSVGLGWSLRIWVSHKCPSLDADGLEPALRTMPRHVPALQIHSPQIPQTPTNCTANGMKNSVPVCILLLDFLRNGKQILFKAQHSLCKTRLTSFQEPASFHPPLSLQSVSATLFAQMVRTVCMFIRLQPCLFTCTHLCFSFSPIKL